MKKLATISICLSLFLLTNVIAGDRLIKGRVLDSQASEPIPGACVVIRETGQQVQTDLDGSFAFQYSSKKTTNLTVTAFGYRPSNLAMTQDETDHQFEIPLESIPVCDEMVTVVSPRPVRTVPAIRVKLPDACGLGGFSMEPFLERREYIRGICIMYCTTKIKTLL